MLSLGRVVATHPESNTVDLVLADGRRVAAVQVLSGSAGGAHGFADLPQPAEQDAAPGDPFGVRVGEDRLTMAVVAFYGPLPVVLGFLFPQVAQCLFQERDRMVYRHASDVYFTVDGAGNVELSHPSGVFLRIGETPAHEDLTGRDFDGRWKIERNTGRQAHVRLHMPNCDVHADPAGNLSVAHAGNLTVHTGGDAEVVVVGDAMVSVGGDAAVGVAGAAVVDVGSSLNVTSGGPATVQAPSVTLDTALTTCTGALVVEGLLTFSAGMAGTGDSNILGNIVITGGDVTVPSLTGPIQVGKHRHYGVKGGTEITNQPMT